MESGQFDHWLKCDISMLANIVKPFLIDFGTKLGSEVTILVFTGYFNVLKLSTVPPRVCCVFLMDLRINSAFFSKRHRQFTVSSGDLICFLRGTNGSFMNYLEESIHINRNEAPNSTVWSRF
jgi:hypothetical protein